MTTAQPPRPRILLLEDSDIDAELIRLHIARAGLEVDWLRSCGRRDFERALGEPVDLVLADYSLPDLDGIEALALARARLPDVPLVFISGVVGEEIATDALRRGATDYVLKRSMPRLAPSVMRALAETRERLQRRRAEAAMIRSEASMRLAVDAAELGLWRYESDGATLTWDARCQQMFDVVGREQLAFTQLLDRIHTDDRGALETAVRTALAGADGGLMQQCRAVGDAGRTRWIVFRGQRFGGTCPMLTGVLQDVTATRELEARQRHTELLFRVATQATGIGVWEFGPGRDDFWIDEGYRALAGLAADDRRGFDDIVASVVHPDDQEMLRRAVRAAYDGSGDTEVDLEHRLAAAGGATPRWIEVKARRLTDADGLARLVGTVRDVSEQRRLEGALRQVNSALEERVVERTRALSAEIGERGRVEDTLRQMQRLEAVGQLTSGVAHDFNNLLAVIISNVSLIKRLLEQKLPVDARVSQRLASMQDAARRGATLIQQLLAFSRRQRLEPQTVALNEILLGMRELLQSSIGGSVNLQADLEPNLWPALVDPTQLELIILNLAINARDAMEVGGSLTVRTANVKLTQPPMRPEEPEPGEYVALAVVDTGTGMDEAVLAKAFEPFFTTKEIGKGSGLGLAQVFGFAKQSGGGVRIETQPGKGTAVHVYMPRSHQAAPPAPQGAGASRPVPIDGGRGRSLMIVDDDHSVREVTASLLRLHGFRVDEAADGAAALRKVARGDHFDLVIADYAMPRMNGAEFARLLRERRPDVPVLFVTGFAELGALDHVPEDYVVQKPIGERELVDRLNQLLART